ncbi:MAG: hypothetical protein ACI9DJ_003233 [Algoriphagus sp.]|jgi:hypothetical protein
MKNFTSVTAKITSAAGLSFILTCGVFFGLHAAAPTTPAPTQVDWQVKGDGSQVYVSWVYNDLITGSNEFVVEQKVEGSSSPLLTAVGAPAWTEIATVPYTGVTDYDITVSGLTSDSTYTWRVKLQSDDGGSTILSGYTESPAFVVSLMTGEATIGELNKSDNSITFYLKDGVSGETNYNILLSESGGPFLLNRQITMSNNEVPITLFGLKANTTYKVQAIAVNGSNENASNEISIKTNRAIPPIASSFVATTRCPEKIGISFVFPDASQFDSWRIVDQATGQQLIGGTSSGSDQKTITGLAAGKAYEFLLYATNETGESITSLKTGTPPYEAPLGATSITDFYGITTSDLTFAWANGLQDTECQNRIRDEYVIEAKIVERDGTEREATFGTFGTSTSFTISGLKPKSTVTAVIVAINNTNGFRTYGERSITGTTFGPPYDPTDFVGTAGKDVLGDNEIVLTWKDNAEDEMGAIIEQGDGNGGFTEIAKINKNENTFYVKPVMDGVTYTFRIKYFNQYGDSDYTEIISVTPPVSTTAARVVVFPNPTVDLINLRVDSAGEGTISLINDANRRVLRKMVNFGRGDVSLDLSKFAPGAYQLIIDTGDTSISKKIYKY